MDDMNSETDERPIPVEPDVQMVLDMMAEAGNPPLEEMTPAEGRALMAAMSQPTADPVELHSVEDLTIEGPGGPLGLRIYRPGDTTDAPLVVTCHGGGWVLGDLDTHDGVARELCSRTGSVVVSVDYRLAPEARFPAAVEDCWAALLWAADNARSLGADPGRLVVAGDSAGGNLAAVLARRARDTGAPRLAAQLLVYPVTDHDFDRSSYLANAEGKLLTRGAMVWFWDHYVPDTDTRKNPDASPLRIDDAVGLAPAVVVLAGHDPLHDEGAAYARLLDEAGVPVTVLEYPGMIHGFFGMVGAIATARRAHADVARALGEIL